MKLYLIYFEWSNTKGNHAGMAHLANKLALDYKNVKLIKMISGKSRLKKALNILYIFLIALYLKIVTRKGDKIFLMEYLARSCFQDKLAMLLRSHAIQCELIGLVHLAGSHLLEIYHSTDVIKSKLDYLDKCVVLGSSLSRFLSEKVGYSKVVTTFHYVDTDYYKPIEKKEEKGNIRILCLGNIKRDFGTLREIVDCFPNLHFDICQGVMDLSGTFGNCPNVQLYGFIEEDELLHLMQNDDVCLSIMTDTVGSNVITTSLATGLVLLVSDVGSIRDYCNSECSFLCKNFEDFKKNIEIMSQNPAILKTYRYNAINRASQLSYDEFKKEFVRIFQIS